MICARCGETIPYGEEMDYGGQLLCEECTMRALSPARACDPWAVRSSQVLTQVNERYSGLSQLQARILEVLEESGGIEPDNLAQRVQLKLPDLERELATLRHMEKIRGKIQSGKKIVILWDTP